MIWKKVRSEIKYWSQVFLLPIFGLSHIMPRSKKIWVLGSTFGRRFADNPKYFYLYLKQYQSEQVHAVWISKSREVIQLLEDNKLEAYYLYSPKGIWYSLRAKVYLYDNYSKDICFTLSGRAVKINLWHGTPLKKIQKDNRFDYVRNPRTYGEKIRYLLRKVSDEKPSDYVLTTSDYLKPIFSSAFQTERVIICGYPRNDNLIRNRIQNVLTRQERETIDQVKKLKKMYRVAFYMPTFRDSEQQLFHLIESKSHVDFLEKHQIQLVIKPHPKTKYYKDYRELEGARIHIVEPREDPYPLIELADILITDYSSIYFDYLLTGRPMIFFPYDLQEYIKDSRELYFDYEELTPGPKVYNQREMEEAMLETPLYEKKRIKTMQMTYDKPEQFAAEQLYEDIKKLLKHR